MARPIINLAAALSATRCAEDFARNMTAAYALSQVKSDPASDYLLSRRMEDAQSAYVRMIEHFGRIGREPAVVVELHPVRKLVTDGLSSDCQPYHERAE